MTKNEATYRSEFSNPFLGLTLVATVVFGMFSYWMFKLTINEAGESIGWSFLFVLPIIGLFIFAITETLKIKRITANNEYLELGYIFLNSTKKILWSEIDAIELKHSFISDGSVNSAGRKYKLIIEGRKIIIYSWLYSNFKGFINELDKRIDTSVKSNMKRGYRNERRDLLTSEKKSKGAFKYIILICLVILIIAFLLK